MRCKEHSKECCSKCFPNTYRQPDDDNSFAVGLATGIATSPAGIIGAAIHDSFSSDDSSAACDSSSDSDCYSGDL